MRISINVVILVPESKNHHTTMITPLTAISPVDGRYRNKTEKLADYFSEAALIRYRIRVEIEYFIALGELPLPQLEGIDHARFTDLRRLYTDFSEADALRVKEIESVTNHDVKAVEYIIKEKMDALGLSAYKEFVHFGLTSQDINNTSIPLSLKEALTGVYYPAVEEVRDKLDAFAKVRGMKLAESKMIEAIHQERAERFKDVPESRLLIETAGTLENGELAEHWRQQVQAEFPFAKVSYANLPCSIACHVGMNSVATVIMTEEVQRAD